MTEPIDLLEVGIDQETLVENDFIPNPLYISIAATDTFREINIHRRSTLDVYVLHLKQDIVLPPSIINKLYYKEIMPTDISTAANYLTLRKITRNILDLNGIMSRSILVNSNEIMAFGEFDVDKIIIVNMMESTSTIIDQLYENYDISYNLKKYRDCIIFNDYYGISSKIFLKYLTCPLDLFWYGVYNSSISILTDQFNRRMFNNNNLIKFKKGKNNNEILDVLQKRFNANAFKSKQYDVYPTDIIEAKTDKSKRIKYFTKYKSTDAHLPKELFYEALLDYQSCDNPVDKSIREMLICNMLSSFNYCHLVFNEKILTKNMDIIYKNKKFVAYAILTLYLEEYNSNCKKNTPDDRYIINLETAISLPNVYFDSNKPKDNPYFPLCVNTDVYDKNIRVKAEHMNGVINNIHDFRVNLCLFTTGNPKIDIFKNIDWTNMIVTGGCMAALLPYRYCQTNLSNVNYYNRYYATSDIDIACKFDTIIQFTNHANYIRRTVAKNCDKPIDEFILTCTQQMACFISDESLKIQCGNGVVPFDYNYVISHTHDEKIIKFFYDKYFTQKYINDKRLIELYPEIIGDENLMKLLNYVMLADFRIIISKYDITKIEGSDTTFDIMDSDGNIFLRLHETIKFKLNSKHILRPLEIFRISEQHFIGCVSRFHLPCVRSYYDGTTCKMTISALIAYKTFYNIDYRYFVGNRDPYSIVNRYRKRGYSTLLNKNELHQFKIYYENTQEIRTDYNNIKFEDILGELPFNHYLFTQNKSSNIGTGILRSIITNDSLIYQDNNVIQPNLYTLL